MNKATYCEPTPYFAANAERYCDVAARVLRERTAELYARDRERLARQEAQATAGVAANTFATAPGVAGVGLLGRDAR